MTHKVSSYLVKLLYILANLFSQAEVRVWSQHYKQTPSWSFTDPVYIVRPRRSAQLSASEGQAKQITFPLSRHCRESGPGGRQNFISQVAGLWRVNYGCVNPPPPSSTAVSGYHNTVMGLSWLTRVEQPERVTKGLRQNLSKSQRSERAHHTGATIPPVSSSLVGGSCRETWWWHPAVRALPATPIKFKQAFFLYVLRYLILLILEGGDQNIKCGPAFLEIRGLAGQGRGWREVVVLSPYPSTLPGAISHNWNQGRPATLLPFHLCHLLFQFYKSVMYWPCSMCVSSCCLMVTLRWRAPIISRSNGLLVKIFHPDWFMRIKFLPH